MSERDAVIVDAVRTPVGKRNGSLANIHAVDLSAHVLNALVARNGFDPAVVDDVIWGCVQQVGQQGLNVARMAVLAAGWPESVPGTTVDRSAARPSSPFTSSRPGCSPASTTWPSRAAWR
jgi:acetyl-CoA acyltransferase